MAEKRRRLDPEFRAGAVRIVLETGKPIAQVARDLGVNVGTLGNWVNQAKAASEGGSGGLSETEREELARLRRENALCRVRHNAFYADGRVMPRRRPEAGWVRGIRDGNAG